MKPKAWNRERLLLSLPAFAVAAYVLISAVGLRILGYSNLLPFSQWDMFTVPAKTSEVFLIEARDDQKNLVCIFPGSCQQFYRHDRLSKVIYLVTQMGQFHERGDRANFAMSKKQFFAELTTTRGLQFVLRKQLIDLADLSAKSIAPGGELLATFSDVSENE